METNELLRNGQTNDDKKKVDLNEILREMHSEYLSKCLVILKENDGNIDVEDARMLLNKQISDGTIYSNPIIKDLLNVQLLSSVKRITKIMNFWNILTIISLCMGVIIGLLFLV